MLSEFKEAEFEDLIVGNIQALGVKIKGKMLTVLPMEGTGLDIERPEQSVYVRQFPCCTVGITGITTATATDSLKKTYMMDFQLVVWIATYETIRKVGETSDIKELRETIRKELYGNNPYKYGNGVARLTFQTDEQVALIDKVVIYEQTYRGQYLETVE